MVNTSIGGNPKFGFIRKEFFLILEGLRYTPTNLREKALSLRVRRLKKLQQYLGLGIRFRNRQVRKILEIPKKEWELLLFLIRKKFNSPKFQVGQDLWPEILERSVPSGLVAPRATLLSRTFPAGCQPNRSMADIARSKLDLLRLERPVPAPQKSEVLDDSKIKEKYLKPSLKASPPKMDPEKRLVLTAVNVVDKDMRFTSLTKLLATLPVEDRVFSRFCREYPQWVSVVTSHAHPTERAILARLGMFPEQEVSSPSPPPSEGVNQGLVFSKFPTKGKFGTIWTPNGWRDFIPGYD